ncbi:MAG: DUF2341 domain-containing protein [Candidatus Nezhaarchaeales archaeon]
MARYTKGLGSVVAMVFILGALIVIFMALSFGMQQQEKVWQTREASLQEELKQIEVAKSVSGVWLYNTDEKKIVVNITNGYIEPVRVTGLVVYYEGGAFKLINGELSSDVEARIIGSLPRQVDSLPIWLAPGETLQLTIVAYQEPKSIAYSVSSVIALAGLAMQKYVQPLNVTPPVNVTPVPTYNLKLIPSIARDVTVTTIGSKLSDQEGQLSSVEVLKGIHVDGVVDDVRRKGDGKYYNVTSARIYQWLEGWQYRRPIYISSQYALSNYQVKIVLNQYNFNFSKAKPDGSDIRFTSSDGVSQIPYWIEKWNATKQEATVWVKVNLTAGTTTIFMYYGSITPVPSQSNLAKVMEKLPASDGLGYTIYYEEWIMPRNLFTTTGSPLGVGGDDVARRFTLPFDFLYYNNTYGIIWLHTNGFIYLSLENPFSSGPYGNATYFGSDGAPTYASNNQSFMLHRLIAPFWADLIIRGDRDIYVNSSFVDDYGSGVYIRWYTGLGWNTQNFGIVVYRNGLIRFDYGEIRALHRSRDTTQVIGISLGDGAHHTVSSYNDSKLSGYPSNANSVMFWPRKKASIEPTVVVEHEEPVGLLHGCEVLLSFNNMPMNVLKLSIDLSLMSNVSNLNVTVAVQEVSNWVEVYSDSINRANYVKSFSFTIVNGRYVGDGTLKLLIRAAYNSAFKLSIDYVRVKAYYARGATLYIAIRGLNYIYVYDIDDHSFSYINASYGGRTILHGTSIAMTFDHTRSRLFVVSGSAIYYYDPINGTWTGLALSSSVGDGCAIEYVRTIDKLVLFEGGGDNTVWIIDPSTGIPERNVAIGIVIDNYTVTSCNGYNIYVINGSAKTLKVDVSRWLDDPSQGLTWLEDAPTTRPVGLAYGGGKLWLIGEGGGLHYYDFEKSTWTPYPQQPPYMPQGPGDRLEYYSGKLYHVRAGGTRELWIIDVDN